MDEGTSRAAHSEETDTKPAGRWERRHWARLALLAFAVGGFVLFAGKAHHQVAVVFEVPPTVYVNGAAISRGELEALEARFFSEDDALVAQSSLHLGAGLEGPLAPALPVTLPVGRYPVRVELRTRDGRRAFLRGTLAVVDPGTARVELR